jgi:adenosine deaminase
VSKVKEIIKELPKAELHLHLEGSIPLTALWNLIKKYDAEKEVGDFNKLQERFQYKDFPHFIETWKWKNGFLREYEDFTYIAAEVAKDLASQNICYVEAFYSPGGFTRHGLKTQKISEAIRIGLNQHSNKIEINLIADLIRDFGPEKGMKWLHEISEVQELGVIGIGIGGSEQEFPPGPFKDVFAKARKLGLHTTAHAGEAAGPESIWGAVKELKVERIGHGTTAIKDSRLLDYLEQHEIPMELCPISNLRTGVVSKLEEHPVKEYFKRGLIVTINTDDPKMFNTTLEKEYMALVEVLDFTLKDIKTLISNSFQSSWLPDKRKEIYINKVNDSFDKLTLTEL